jgi:hypothetical protein
MRQAIIVCALQSRLAAGIVDIEISAPGESTGKHFPRMLILPLNGRAHDRTIPRRFFRRMALRGSGKHHGGLKWVPSLHNIYHSTCPYAFHCTHQCYCKHYMNKLKTLLFYSMNSTPRVTPCGVLMLLPSLQALVQPPQSPVYHTYTIAMPVWLIL